MAILHIIRGSEEEKAAASAVEREREREREREKRVVLGAVWNKTLKQFPPRFRRGNFPTKGKCRGGGGGGEGFALCW